MDLLSLAPVPVTFAHFCAKVSLSWRGSLWSFSAAPMFCPVRLPDLLRQLYKTRSPVAGIVPGFFIFSINAVFMRFVGSFKDPFLQIMPCCPGATCPRSAPGDLSLLVKLSPVGLQMQLAGSPIFSRSSDVFCRLSGFPSFSFIRLFSVIAPYFRVHSTLRGSGFFTPGRKSPFWENFLYRRAAWVWAFPGSGVISKGGIIAAIVRPSLLHAFILSPVCQLLILLFFVIHFYSFWHFLTLF